MEVYWYFQLEGIVVCGTAYKHRINSFHSVDFYNGSIVYVVLLFQDM